MIMCCNVGNASARELLFIKIISQLEYFSRDVDFLYGIESAAPSKEPANETLYNESFWLTYQIPFNRLDSTTLEELCKGTRSKSVKNTVINFVIDDIRKQRTTIPSKWLKIIARKLVDSYPETFKDVDDDEVTLGDGSYSTYQKLLDRNSYLNRPHKRPTGLPSTPKNVKYRKSLTTARAGCVNWQPVNATVPANSIAAIKERLRLAVQKLNILDDKEKKEIITDLETTYYQQRTYINQSQARISDILKEWPILFVHEYMLWHYEKLMGHSVKKISENFRIKKDKLLEFGKRNRLCMEREWDDETSAKETLKVIVGYFKEDLEYLLVEVDRNLDMTQVKTYSPTPTIVAFTDKRYYLFIENMKINNGTENLYECLEELFAMYYICNMTYPRNCSCTLEFLQRYFLKIHPDYGTKSRRGAHSKHRVLTFINKLKAY